MKLISEKPQNGEFAPVEISVFTSVEDIPPKIENPWTEVLDSLKGELFSSEGEAPEAEESLGEYDGLRWVVDPLTWAARRLPAADRATHSEVSQLRELVRNHTGEFIRGFRQHWDLSVAPVGADSSPDYYLPMEVVVKVLSRRYASLFAALRDLPHPISKRIAKSSGVPVDKTYGAWRKIVSNITNLRYHGAAPSDSKMTPWRRSAAEWIGVVAKAAQEYASQRIEFLKGRGLPEKVAVAEGNASYSTVAGANNLLIYLAMNEKSLSPGSTGGGPIVNFDLVEGGSEGEFFPLLAGGEIRHWQ